MKPAQLFAAVCGMLCLVLFSQTKASSQVVNGSFETGDFTGWTTTTTGTPFIDWTVSMAGDGSGFLIPTSPQDGMFDAWNGFDGAGPMSFSMHQDIAVPATPGALEWKDRTQWDFLLTSSATLPRTYTVQLLDPTTLAVLATLYSFDTGIDHVVGDTGWLSHSADVSAFAGTTVRLQFDEAIPEVFTGPAQLEFDDIRLPSLGVPEPTSMAFLAGMLLSSASMFLRRRRS